MDNIIICMIEGHNNISILKKLCDSFNFSEWTIHILLKQNEKKKKGRI